MRCPPLGSKERGQYAAQQICVTWDQNYVAADIGGIDVFRTAVNGRDPAALIEQAADAITAYMRRGIARAMGED